VCRSLLYSVTCVVLHKANITIRDERYDAMQRGWNKESLAGESERGSHSLSLHKLLDIPCMFISEVVVVRNCSGGGFVVDSCLRKTTLTERERDILYIG